MDDHETCLVNTGVRALAQRHDIVTVQLGEYLKQSSANLALTGRVCRKDRPDLKNQKPRSWELLYYIRDGYWKGQSPAPVVFSCNDADEIRPLRTATKTCWFYEANGAPHCATLTKPYSGRGNQLWKNLFNDEWKLPINCTTHNEV